MVNTNNDYYFAAGAAECNSKIGGVFDAVQAVVRLNGIPTEWSSLSRRTMVARIHQGPGNSSPVDAYATDHNLRLALCRCPGHPSNYSVTMVYTNYATAISVAGVATFSNVSVGAPATDYYSFATTP